MARAVTALVAKDLSTEFRRPETLVASLLLALAVLLALRLTSPPGDPPLAAASALWLALFLATALLLLRGFAREADGGTLDALLLAPVSRFQILGGKALSAWASTLSVAAFVLLLGAAVFEVDLAAGGAALLAAFLLGTLALATLGTLAGAVAVRARDRQALLPAILISVGLFTVLLPSVSATVRALSGDASAWGDLRVPAASLLVLTAIAFAASDALLED